MQEIKVTQEVYITRSEQNATNFRLDIFNLTPQMNWRSYETLFYIQSNLWLYDFVGGSIYDN